MDNSNDTTRRTVLQGFPLAAVAVSMPLLLSHSVAAGYSPVPALIERHKAARIASRQASQTADAVYVAFHALNRDEPIKVDLPGIQRAHPRSVPVTQTSPDAIREVYAHYGFHSRRGGGVFRNGRLVPIDLAAASARDEAQALANFDRAIERLQERAEALGEPAAAQADGGALEAENDARLALLASAPVGHADAKAKADYLLSMLDVEPDWLDPIDVRTLVASIGGGA